MIKTVEIFNSEMTISFIKIFGYRYKKTIEKEKKNEIKIKNN